MRTYHTTPAANWDMALPHTAYTPPHPFALPIFLNLPRAGAAYLALSAARFTRSLLQFADLRRTCPRLPGTTTAV